MAHSSAIGRGGFRKVRLSIVQLKYMKNYKEKRKERKIKWNSLNRVDSED